MCRGDLLLLCANVCLERKCLSYVISQPGALPGILGPMKRSHYAPTTIGHANKCNHTCRTTQTIAIALNNYTIAGLELSYSI